MTSDLYGNDIHSCAEADSVFIWGEVRSPKYDSVLFRTRNVRCDFADSSLHSSLKEEEEDQNLYSDWTSTWILLRHWYSMCYILTQNQTERNVPFHICLMEWMEYLKKFMQHWLKGISFLHFLSNCLVTNNKFFSEILETVVTLQFFIYSTVRVWFYQAK